MARIKISDLPVDMKISADEMKRVRGGFATALVGGFSAPTSELFLKDFKFTNDIKDLSAITLEGAVQGKL